MQHRPFPQERDRILAAYIAAMQRLADILMAAIRALWRNLPAYNRRDANHFVNQAVPLVVGAEQQAAALTRAFIAHQTDSRIVPIDVNAVIGRSIRNGVEPAEVYRRPFVTLWKDLKDGKLYLDAVHAGESRAVSAADTDLQLTKRATAQAVQDAQPNIFGFRRVAHPDACARCKLLASKGGAYVKHAGMSKESKVDPSTINWLPNAFQAPIHNHCRCILVPLTEPHPGAVFMPDGTRIRDYPGGPIIRPTYPDGVAVHDHGEMGNVAYDPDWHFTPESQVA